MTIKNLIKSSETRQVKLVFKNTINDYSTLFGGIAMSWMDEVAYVTATRFCRKKVVTISVKNIAFTKPIPHGTIVELIGVVTKAGNVKLEVTVSIYIERKYSTKREKAVEGVFYFAAIDGYNKPIKLIDTI